MEHKRMDLAGKLALVTGGGRGIGRAVALSLAEQGADVLVNYLRNEDAATETAEAVRALGRQAETIRGHVGDPARVERMFAQIVGISSLGSGRVLPEYSAVGVSKAALESLTRYLAVELAPIGISVNVVS